MVAMELLAVTMNMYKYNESIVNNKSDRLIMLILTAAVGLVLIGSAI